VRRYHATTVEHEVTPDTFPQGSGHIRIRGLATKLMLPSGRFCAVLLHDGGSPFSVHPDDAIGARTTVNFQHSEGQPHGSGFR